MLAARNLMGGSSGPSGRKLMMVLRQQQHNQQGSLRLIGTATAPLSVYAPTMVEGRVGEAGTGRRASVSGLKVALFGASGFLGNYVCSDLGANGYCAYLANRGDDLEMRHLKVPFDLGRTRFVFYSPRDKDSIREVIADADVVVNMIGKYYESGQPVQTSSFPFLGWQTNYSFEDTNVTIPQTLAEICLEMQVDHFIHVSSASASPDAQSDWSRTKYEGEQAVKEIYPWATIIKPTQLFGRQDRLLNGYARMSLFYGMVPLLDEGKALTQPVWVGDVAKTILRVCDEAAKYQGKTIDCFGPKDYSYSELAHFVNDITERNKPIVPVPHDIFGVLARFMEMQRDPLVTKDLVKVWGEDFLPTYASPEEYAKNPDLLTMADLGVEAQSMEKIMFEWLQIYRYGGHFWRVEGYH